MISLICIAEDQRAPCKENCKKYTEDANGSIKSKQTYYYRNITLVL